jgi:ABC-2 type transport system ATP-binding protein
MMSHALSVRELQKVYHRRGKDIVAVDGINFEIEPGSVVGLLGPNGAGKTTTIKCCLGLVEPTSGEISVAGFNVRNQRGRALRHVGAVLEGNRNVYWYLTPLENLVFFANLAGIPSREARQRALDLLERFGLANRVNSRTGELSRGNQQKVAICAALVRRPDLLLLDEPTLGLDVEIAAQMREQLLELAREHGRTVVITSHQLDLVEAICERVIIVQRGRIIADERTDHLLDLFTTRSFRFHIEGALSASAAEEVWARFPEAGIQTDGPATAVEITFEHGAHLYEVMQIFQQENVVLRSMEHMTPDLEEVFLRLTQEGASIREGEK